MKDNQNTAVDLSELPVDPSALNELLRVFARRMRGEISHEDMQYLISRINPEE